VPRRRYVYFGVRVVVGSWNTNSPLPPPYLLLGPKFVRYGTVCFSGIFPLPTSPPHYTGVVFDSVFPPVLNVGSPGYWLLSFVFTSFPYSSAISFPHYARMGDFSCVPLLFWNPFSSFFCYTPFLRPPFRVPFLCCLTACGQGSFSGFVASCVPRFPFFAP